MWSWIILYNLHSANHSGTNIRNMLEPQAVSLADCTAGLCYDIFPRQLVQRICDNIGVALFTVAAVKSLIHLFIQFFNKVFHRVMV